MIEIRGDAAFLSLSGAGQLQAIIDIADIPLLGKGGWRAVERAAGYPYARSNSRRAGMPYLHRLLMNAQQGQMIDHANGNTLDNRRANLRFATRRQNVINSCKRRVEMTSRFKGVYFEKLAPHRPWVMTITGRRRQYYASEIEAALAYDTAAKQIFGEFARLNFPDGYVSAPHAQQHRSADVQGVGQVVQGRGYDRCSARA